MTDLWKILAWVVRIGGASGLQVRDMTVAFVPTWLEFSLKSLLGIQARLSDAAIVRYEGAGDEVGSVWTFFVVVIRRYMDPANGPHLQYSAPGRFALMYPSGQGCRRSPVIFTNPLSQLGLSLLLLGYVSVSGLRS